MENKKELIIKTFNNSFNLQRFVDFTQELFKGHAKYKNSLEFSPKVKGEFNNVVKEFLELGWYKDKNRESMVIAVVRLEREDSVARSRSIQRNFVKEYFLKSGSDSALVAFYNKDSGDWRLSFIKLDYSYKDAKTEEELTPAKRFSFLLGENEKHHTAIARFLPLITTDLDLPTIKEIEEVFNIEVVTREFFEIYCDLYLEIKKCIDKQEGFYEMAQRLNFKSDEFGKKIMGQLVFLYFLQKKGWLGVEANPKEINEKEADSLLENKSYDSVDAFEKIYELKNGKYIRNDIIINKFKDEETIALNSIFTNTKYDGNWGSGDKNFIRSLFNRAIKEEKNFYKDFLEHVFYNALNDKRGGSIYFKELNCKIPFLNGGLFQPISEKYDYENSNFTIPNEIFSNNKKTKQGDIGDGILDIFDRYAFTVKEDEPLEKEVAVDPEMLGKVFENLLDVVDRKKKGAFYTPREIVHYMCQESLIKYLVTEVGIEYKDAEILIRYGDVLADIDSSKKASETGDFKMPLEVRKNAKKIDTAFLNVKVADPAVGSGAFPLGMLHEIVRARMNLTQYMIDDINAIHRVYTNVKGRKPYDLKLQTIQRCIHAVDIERSAVDIAKLRLWLSLVVEENDFRNVKPLPNLDYNIMVGNSLLEEFEGVKLFNEKLLEEEKNNLENESLEQIDFFNRKKESEYLLDEIYDLQEKFFSVNSREEKIKLRDEIDKREWVLIEKTVRENGKEELLPKIEEFKRTNTKPYFLWKLNFAKVFREKGGFDIVIGNPPYVGESGNKDIFRPIANTSFGKQFYKGKMDLYYFFFHLAINLSRQGGIVSFITTNYYINADGAVKLREDFKKRTVILKLINFNELRIFETARGQHNMITILNKVTDENFESQCCITDRKGNADTEQLKDIVSWKDVETTYFCKKQKDLYDDKGNIVFYEDDSILLKMKNLYNYKILDKSIGNGIDILQESVTEKHIETCPNLVKGEGVFALTTAELKCISLSDDEKEIIKPYFTSEQIQKYYIDGENTKWIVYTDKEVCLNISKYPNIISHLDKFEDIITSDNKPYGLHRARQESIFKGAKLLSLRMTKEPCFTYSDIDTYVTRAYLVIKPEDGVDLRYLLGLLNSKLFYYWFYKKGKRKGQQLQIDKQPIVGAPIFLPDNLKQESISLKVGELIKNLKDNGLNNDSDLIKNEIDLMVYAVYGLSDIEVDFLNNWYVNL